MLSVVKKNVFVNVNLNDLVCFIGEKVIILTFFIKSQYAACYS